MNKLLLTDVDGVLFDWVKKFAEYIKGQGIKTRSEEPMDWHLHKWLGVTSAEAHEMVEEFNRSDAFRNLEPIAGAVDALKYFKKAGWKIVAITACSADKKAIAHREQNLVREFGSVFANIHCVALGTSKNDILSLYQYNQPWWIEDRFENALEGKEKGFNTILFSASHNKHQDVQLHGIHRCNNWIEVVALTSEHEALDDACRTIDSIAGDWPDEAARNAEFLVSQIKPKG